MNNTKKLIRQKDLFFASFGLILNELITSDTLTSVAQKYIDNVFNNDDENIDMQKAIVKKYYNIIICNIILLEQRNVKLFNLKDEKGNKITLITGIDLSKLKCVNDNIWNYLIHMFNSSIMLSKSNIDMLNTEITDDKVFEQYKSIYPNSFISKRLTELNPFVGIVSDGNAYGVNELLSGPDILKDQTKPIDLTSIEGLSSALGVDKMTNEFTEELNNMTDEKFDEAINSIESMLKGADDKTRKTIRNVMEEFKNEINENKLNGETGVASLMNVAQNVAKKIVPDVQKNNIDMNDLWKQAMNLKNECKTADGKKIFDENSPLTTVTNMIERKMKNGNVINTGTDEQDLNDCKNMFKQMGIDMPNNLNYDNMLSMLKK